MEYIITAIKIEKRENSAVKVQNILTEYGCIIKVRLGLHDVPSDTCTSSGLVLLEIINHDNKLNEMLEKLNSVDGVTAKTLLI